MLEELYLERGSPILRLVIPRHLVELVCDISRAYGKELAGLAVGSAVGGTVYIEDVVLGENLSEEERRFLLDPRAVVEAFRFSETIGREVVALLHTHRCGALPSSLDVDGMKLWPIPWVVVDESRCLARAWVLEEGSLREVPVEVSLTKPR
ncbi:MAG: Mov34/MPN/PAD-1 family protein [Sulfolobales archaeon]|nr:Mov34/MPN/PAD-1 family protein [Sulfolobales archaeon]MCX8208378.1 Mov34/MPN/PAD-1 family protein [Sulfolobales archaeon]MDW8010663.1 Mov34/MPN/PAD-1 family protein [Sulfolobales archaeon]